MFWWQTWISFGKYLRDTSSRIQFRTIVEVLQILKLEILKNLFCSFAFNVWHTLYFQGHFYLSIYLVFLRADSSSPGWIALGAAQSRNETSVWSLLNFLVSEVGDYHTTHFEPIMCSPEKHLGGKWPLWSALWQSPKASHRTGPREDCQPPWGKVRPSASGSLST